MSLQEVIRRVKEAYPGFYPYAYIETDGKYVFNLVPKGRNVRDSMMEFHVVDPESGHVTGYISPMELFKNKNFREKWKHANKVSDHDEDLQHSLFGKKKRRAITP